MIIFLLLTFAGSLTLLSIWTPLSTLAGHRNVLKMEAAWLTRFEMVPGFALMDALWPRPGTSAGSKYTTSIPIASPIPAAMSRLKVPKDIPIECRSMIKIVPGDNPLKHLHWPLRQAMSCRAKCQLCWARLSRQSSSKTFWMSCR